MASVALGACAAPPRAQPTQPPSVVATPALSQRPATGFHVLDPFEQVKQFSRGVNFGNALEAPKEGDWGMTLEEGFFDLVKSGGFATIRLPVKWSGHALRQAPYTIEPAFLARVDWAVDNALKRGLNIVVNMHNYDEIVQQSDPEHDRFLGLWEQISAHYKDAPAAVVLEPLNEPNGALTAGTWQRLFDDTLAVIRKANPERNVIFTGADWGGPSALRGMKRPDDPHLIATFHYYQPFAFTHQGAEWVQGSNQWIGTKWKGDSGDRVNVDFDFDQVAQWAKANKIPVWMGEFGSYGKYGDRVSRQRWTAYVARQAEQRGFAWAYWEFGAGFGVYDRANKTWIEPIHTALVPPG